MIGRIAGVAVVFVGVALMAAGCASKAEETLGDAGPNYGRQLPPGATALRLITNPTDWPQVGTAYKNRDALLTEAIDRSIDWFRYPSSREHFPFDSITHEQANASVIAFRELLTTADSEATFVAEVQRMFDVYQSIGYDGRGVVLYTGYFSPIFRGSMSKWTPDAAPLYRRPSDLVTDPKSGEPIGKQTADGRVVSYETRRQIEQTGMLAGTELVWLEDALASYIAHVNGSAKIRLDDGSVLYVGYNGKTDRPYASLGKAMIEAGLMSENNASLASIKKAYRANPEAVRELMYNNENFVFFTEYPEGKWPSGSLGVRVSAERSLATDKKVFPRGGVVMVDTHAQTFTGTQRPFQQFMLDQDTGGAIRAPGRADIYMGIGPSAEILAGGQYAEGYLFYFFLKPEYVAEYAPRDTLVRR